MLWSFPARAQPPIVDGVKWTLAAFRISDASANVIQSAADPAIGQSAPAVVVGVGLGSVTVDARSLDDPESDPPEDVRAGSAAGGAAESPRSSRLEVGTASLPPALAEAFVLAAAPRSFLAQPEPLKCTAGAANPLRIAAPHLGHAAGPWPWIPWTTSISCPQAVQM
jgi:hypothetical protein